MKRYFLACMLVLLAAYILIAYAGKKRAQVAPLMTPNPHTLSVSLTPEKIEWKPFYEGAEIAVLHGDPTKEGSPYVIRIRHRDGLKVPPHWHPFDEQLTVISGTWMMGMGEGFDLSNMQEFPAGSYLVSPKNVPHYAVSKGETIVQVHGTGPFAAYFVNPDDDVFKQKN